MKNLRILLLCVFAACSYGVVHDQITARICLEYFTVAHPPLFHTHSPTLLALCWGVTATAGIGAALGVVLALVSQSGSAVAVPIARLRRLVLLLLAIMSVSAVSAGVAGYWLSKAGFISIPAGLAEALPAVRHDRFMAVWFAHCASYFVGEAGGALLCFGIWQARGRPFVIPLFPRTRAGGARAALLAALAAYAVWVRFASH